jgi:two-component system, chemotaxis family, chemotaxis protein CheY
VAGYTGRYFVEPAAIFPYHEALKAQLAAKGGRAVIFGPSLAILVVDDQQPMRKTIAYILRQAGMKNINFAEDGETAWAIINRDPVDMVLLDWNMPRMSGLELLTRIRRSERYGRLPVVMITAEANEEHVLTAIDEGVTAYVVKPFVPAILIKKMHEAFELAQRVRRRAG